jgi:hypothetical protein
MHDNIVKNKTRSSVVAVDRANKGKVLQLPYLRLIILSPFLFVSQSNSLS